MAIEINHHFPDMKVSVDTSDFEKAMQFLADKLAGISNTLNKTETKETVTSGGKSKTSDGEVFQILEQATKKQSETIEKSMAKFKELDLTGLENRRLYNQVKGGVTKLSLMDDPKAQQLVTSTNNLVKELNEGKKTQQEFNAGMREIQTQLPKSNQPEATDKFNGNLIKTILGAGISAAALSIGESYAARGGIIGSASQSLNTGILNSVPFVNNYQAQLLQNSTQMQNTGATAVFGAAGALLGSELLPGVGTAIGGLAGAGLGAMFSNENNQQTQQQIAGNQFLLTQDTNAWRMRNVLGIGSSAFHSVTIGDKTYGTQLSNLQHTMLNNGNSAYANYLPDVAMNSNRQAWRNERNQQGMTKDLVAAAGLLGYSGNVGGFTNIASTAAMVTGNSTSNVVNNMLQQNAKYGGDTAKNTAMMVQLMQTTGMGASRAMDLANRYQYNPAALQNVTNFATAMPVEKWIGSQFGRLAGLSNSELANGAPSAKTLSWFHQAQRTAATSQSIDPRLIALEQWFSAIGYNPNVSNAGVMGAIKGKGSANLTAAEANLPAAMKAFTDQVINALSNLTVPVMNIEATAVNMYNSNTHQGQAGWNNQSNYPAAQSHLQSASGSGTNAIKKGIENGYWDKPDHGQLYGNAAAMRQLGKQLGH